MAGKTFNKLPEALRTPTQKRFFDATVEQLFSSRSSVKVNGFIGRRRPGFYDPKNDYYLEQINKTRTWYQLEPIAISQDDSTLEVSNEVFYHDLLNRIEFLQGNTDNHDRLFNSRYYCFAPPIDLDKFINFQAYYWATGLPAIEMPGLTDPTIESDILGQLEYTYTKTNGDTIEFTNGLKVTFPDTLNYNVNLTVGGVGKGIYLTEQLVTVDTNPDYITIERGSPDGNTWSRTNSWYHKEVLQTIAKETGADTFSDAQQGRRPIIEFIRDLELFDSGIRFIGDIDLADGNKTFDEVNGQVPPVAFDGVELEDGDLIIFLNDTGTATFYGAADSYVVGSPPFNYTLTNPYTDGDDVYTVVKRASGDMTLDRNPSWFTLEDQDNVISSTVDTDGMFPDEVFSNVTGDGFTYTVTLTDITNVRDIEVRANGIFKFQQIEYDYVVSGSDVIVTFVFDQTGNTIDITVSDDIPGLTDGTFLMLNERDTLDVYINGNVEELSEIGTDVAGDTYIFQTQIPDIDITKVIGVTIINFNGVTYEAGSSYDYIPGDTNNDVVTNIDFVNENVRVTIAPAVPSTGVVPSSVMLVVANPIEQEVNVADYIWQVRFRTFLDEFGVEQSDQILLPYPDFGTPVVEGDTVYVEDGQFNAGKNFYYDGSGWVLSTNTKSSINQAPLFNLYYTNLDTLDQAIPLGDFPNSTFAGSEIFSYKVDPQGASIDPFLGFAVEYKNIGQVSDIVFEHDLETVRYDYIPDSEFVEIPGYYYFKKTNPSPTGVLDPTYEYTWWPFEGTSKQRVIDRFEIAVADRTNYLVSVTPEPLGNGLFDVKADYEDDNLVQGPEPLIWPSIVDYDYFVVTDGSGNATKEIILTNNVSVTVNTALEFRTWSTEALNEEDRGYYEIPKQLENNPNYEEVNEYTANEFASHFASIMENQDGFVGDARSSKNNYRDTAEDLSLGEFILQTEGALLKPMFFVSEEYLDIVIGTRFSGQEYTRYKDKVTKTARQLIQEAFAPDSGGEILNIEITFNEIIERVSNTVEYFDAFTLSYMLDWSTSFTTETFTSQLFPDPDAGSIEPDGTIDLDFEIDLSTFKNGVLLFTTDVTGTDADTMLVIDVDYEIVSSTSIKLLDYNQLTFDGKLVVRYYEDTVPALIPSTPSKIGCALTYRPGIELDNSYVDPVYVIVGHDGSRTPTYTRKEVVDYIIANVSTDPTVVRNFDLRDRALLEFEERIYNHTVDKFRVDYDLLFRHEDIRPGAFRDVNYSLEEYFEIFRSSFLKWANRTKTNYRIHDEFDVGDWMTWNYRLANPGLPGHWKGLYRYYYDTIFPGDKPWEMLGFSIQPEWWETEYGIDYSSSNTAMWTDLELGYIRQGNREGFDTRFARPGLAAIIPVDSLGNNLPPHLIGIAVEPTDLQKAEWWIYGDNAPVEDAWINSSEYRYVIMEKQFLMRPGIFGELYWNPYDIVEAPVNNEQVISDTTLTRRSNSEYIVHGELVDGEPIVKHGYQRFITDRVYFLGKDPTVDFGNFLRNLNVKLGHRYGGYTNRETLSVFTEGTSTGSSNVNLKIPDENIDVKVHKGKAVHEYVYSGVAIIINEYKRFEVRGYDVLTPEFKVYPRDPDGRAQQITIGGTPAAFRNFRSGETYQITEFVLYNTRYYQSNVEQTVQKFTDGDWKLLSELPSVNGVSVSYNPTPDTTQYYTVDYSTQFETIQEVFDFLIGHGDYLESQGWKFDNVDTDVNVVEDWLSVAKDYAFWATNNWAVGNTLFVSPGSYLIKLDVAQGYPEDIERLTNGVYSILDEYGYAIPPRTTLVNRDDQRIEVSLDDATSGIYGLRVSAKETEHIFIFDNTTVFNDIIYDPLLMARQRRLEVKGFRTTNWIGKFEADGYIIQGDKLTPNFENITRSIRDYYNSEVPLDNPVIEDTARHLIGYQNREYLENLRLFDDTQYLFYKGMISEKGSIQPVDKILRSSFIEGSKEIQIFEDWAFRIGEFGAVNDNTFIEFLIENNDLRSDPQMVQLVYPPGPAGTVSVRVIIVTNAQDLYTTPPIVAVIPQGGDTPIANATAEAVLGDDGRIASITVINEGSGYTVDPIIQIILPGGIATNDTAFPVTRNEITIDDPLDDLIVIDIDDVDRWLTRPHGQRYTTLIPMMQYRDLDVPILNAGYVHLEDIEFTSFNIEGLFAIWEDPLRERPVANEYIWVADTTPIDLDWAVFRTELRDPINVFGNAIDKISGDGILYTYEFRLQTDPMLTPITKLTDSEGTVVWDVDNDITIVDPYAWTEVLIFINVRYTTDGDVPGTELRYWMDQYQGGGWAFYGEFPNPEVGNLTPVIVERYEEPLVNSSLFEESFIYDKITKNTLIDVPIYDPFKSFIPGIADRNLTYKADVDPARYTNASNAMLINSDLAFNDTQVGKLWWDLSTCRYLYYEQGTPEYRRNNWGVLFPGSTIDIYEWTRSTVTPDQYEDEGTPRNITDYVERVEYNSLFNSRETVYYFWVTNKTTIPNNIARRTMSTINVSRLIQNPRNQGYAWLSFVDPFHYVFNNLNSFMSDRQTIVQINYRFNDTENPKHVEWELITEGSPTATGDIDDVHWDKLVDSITQYDAEGRYVPDPKLSEFERYGTRVRPRQTWFIDVVEARKILYENANPNLVTINLRDDNAWDDTQLSTNNYWEYADWYAEGFDATNTIPRFQIPSGRAPGSEGAPPPPNLTPAQEDQLNEGDIVKSVETGNSAYYEWANGVLTNLVRREKTAFQIKSDIYTNSNLTNLSEELREIMTAIREQIFINDYDVNLNLLFFAMINYVAFEQKKVDWFFKTTYIQILQEGQSLGEQPKNFVPDALGSFIDYIIEVKPYQTKVRDYSVSIGGFIDEVFGTAWDYDSAFYWTDENGDTQYPADPEPDFDPEEIRREFDIFSIYDSVQCGFIDKDYTVELGRVSLSGDGTTTEWVIEEIDSASKVLVDGRVLDDTEYATREEIVTRNLILTFAVAPPVGTDNILVISKVKFTHTSLEEMRLMYNAPRQTVTQTEQFIGDGTTTNYELIRTFGFQITDITITIDGEEVLDDSWTVLFTSTSAFIVFATPPDALAEIEVTYSINNPADIKLVNFDLEVASNGQVRSGWGVPLWDAFGWNVPGFSLQDDPSNIRGFKVYAGAANRFLKMQTDLHSPIFTFAINNNIVNYSAYNNKSLANAPTIDELESLQTFNERYMEVYECNFQGIYLDAQTFTYELTQPYDSEGWDDLGWDRQIPLPTVDPAVPADFTRTAQFTGNGSSYIARIPYEVIIGTVTVDGVDQVEGVDYTVTTTASQTDVVFTVAPALGLEVLIPYNHVSDDNFDNIEILPTIDGGVFVPQDYDAGVTDELAVYNVTESITIRVDTNTEEFTEEFTGTGTDTVFTFTENSGRGITIESASIDGTPTTDYKLVITVDVSTTNYAIEFDVAPANGAVIEVTYRIGSLRQYYVADDARHYDPEPINSFFLGGLSTQISMTESAGFGARPYDSMDPGDPTNPAASYLSRYLLPVPFVATPQVPDFATFVESIRVFVMDDSSLGVTDITRKESGVDYIAQIMSDYLAGLTMTPAELIDHEENLRGQYQNYIQDFYVGAFTPAEFDLIFNNSIMITFASEHHMHEINPLDPVDVGLVPQKILFDYALQKVSYRAFLDEMDQSHYTRNADANSALTAETVTSTQRTIKLNSSAGMPIPTINNIGVAWMGGERITYTNINGNTLEGVTRHTLGTSIDAEYNAAGDIITTYPIGKKVIAGDKSQNIPQPNTLPWVNNAGGLGLSTTAQALFLRSSPGSSVGT